jgi:glycosyltransferase involved in cell wall biosynthesis
MEYADAEVKIQKMVIAFDAKRLFNNFTGLGNYSRTLVKNLQSYFPENEYHLFTPEVRQNEETKYFLDQSKFIVHTPKKKYPLWRTWGMSSEINELKPHIYHGLSHEIPFGLKKNIHTVVTFHDMIYEIYPDQFNWFDRNIYHFKYKNAALRAKSIVSISENTKLDIANIYGIDDKKIKVVYQSCNDLFQDKDTPELQLSEVLRGLSDYYLYVGSIIERKALLQIVIAFSLLPEEYRKAFVVVGTGKNKYCDKVHDLIIYYGLEKYFYFVGAVSNEELVSVYDASFCLIYPSIYEGFGIPVIEALFREKPVITSSVSSLPEAAGPGGLLVNPFSPEDIAAAMIKIHNKKEYQSLASLGLSYVRSRFSAYKTAKEMMNFYGNLM